MTLLKYLVNSFTAAFVALFYMCTSGNEKSPGNHAAAIVDNKVDNHNKPTEILPGSYLFDKYLKMLKGRSVAVFANNTAMVGNTHLVDTLRKQGVNIKKIFAPEHGFRGTADAGEKVDSYTDKQTGIAVISLYGKKRKPSADDVKDVDVIVFDIQDVGTRFYTYISSLQDMMEACVQLNKSLIVLDRPNPNGFYVDGPVLDMQYKSFVGMQPVPVVYGMTIGEYANMLLNEKMLTVNVPYPVTNIDDAKDPNAAMYGKKLDFSLTVIRCGNYTHKSKYVLPVKPSPNLPDIQAIYLYPSTCFFEGTVLSEGRGTNKPFKVFGHPSLPKNLYSFTPNPTEGAKSSKLYGQLCYGWNLDGTPEEVLKATNGRIQLKWLMEAYKLFPVKDSFFIIPKSGKMEDSFFNKLSGNNELWKQIRAGLPEDEIRKSWEPKLSAFKKIRKKYLLYEDF
ncbi:MAG: exo-beta-N-acetylmuramidase NamZ family protein [Agriterribacter sp.]